MQISHFNSELSILSCVFPRVSKWNYTNLSAPYWRLYWNREEGAVVSLEGKETALGPSRIVAISPNTPFRARTANPVKHLYLHWTVAPPFGVVAPGVFSFPVTPHVRSLLDRLCPLLEADSDNALETIPLALSLIAWTLCRLPQSAISSAIVNRHVAAAIRQADVRLDRRISNPELARYAGMNTNAFIRLFKQVTGQTPQHYFRMRRIDKACLMLHFSDDNLDVIAEKTGFCDRYHFSREFRRFRGIGPAAFRKTHESSAVRQTSPKA